MLKSQPSHISDLTLCELTCLRFQPQLERGALGSVVIVGGVEMKLLAIWFCGIRSMAKGASEDRHAHLLICWRRIPGAPETACQQRWMTGLAGMGSVGGRGRGWGVDWSWPSSSSSNSLRSLSFMVCAALKKDSRASLQWVSFQSQQWQCSSYLLPGKKKSKV